MRNRLIVPTLTALFCFGGQASAQISGGPGFMRTHAAEIAHAYLEGWSSGNAQALADVQAFYGRRVSFYGQFVNKRALFDQKLRFGQRWPIRRYTHRPGTMRVTCENATQACLVRSIIDWRAENPFRGKVARGSSTFELGISFSGPRPVVLFEKGRVIRNGRTLPAG